MPSASDTLSPVSAAFVHSLNLQLKFARLYGPKHARTLSQMEEAWDELHAAIGAAGPSGLVLGVSGAEILVDGAIVGSTAAERSLAHALASANIASIAFTAELNRESFAQFVRTFSESNVRPSQLIERLRSAIGEGPESGIRINEIRFVTADFRDAGSLTRSIAPALPSEGNDGENNGSLRDPETLIQLITAATESSGREINAGLHFGEELLGSSHVSGGVSAAHSLSEGEMRTLLHLIANFTEISRKSTDDAQVSSWKERLANLPAPALAALRDALAEISAQSRSKDLNDAAILHLAEGLSIHYTLARFQRGAVKAGAVRPLLDKLGAELGPLRKALHSPENKTSKAGFSIESHSDILDRRFWSSVSESEERAVLLSSEGWCVPPPNVQQYVDQLLRHGDSATAENILMQYAGCVSLHNPEARKKSAIGLSQMAELYARAVGGCLGETMRVIGEQLAVEHDTDVQNLLGAAFVRFSQAAAEQSSFPALGQALDTLAVLEKSQPIAARNVRPRIGIKNRIPAFIEKGLKSEAVRPELVEVLRRVPQAAAEQLSIRLMRVTRSGEREQVVAMARALGKSAQEYLRQTLAGNPASNGVRVVGLLSRIDPASVEELLPGKIQAGETGAHDEVLRQLSIAGAPERGRMLMRIVERMDQMILPMALDEIGMCGDASVAPELLRLAEGQLLPDSSDFLRVKAVEALGRLRAPETTTQLIRFIEARRAWRWAYPNEMRVAAAQALAKLEPEHTATLLAGSGLDPQMLSLAPLDARPERDFVRYRRYPRIKMSRPVPAVIQSKRGKYQPAVQVLSFEGGLLSGDFQLSVGTAAGLQISSGRRPIHLEVLVRFARPNQAGVEMVGMGLEDRSRLRTLLVSMAASAPPSQTPPIPA
ncbi:MAG: HEAT repeat domain-containing protein [Candidatus Acidiferrales bacterium]